MVQENLKEKAERMIARPDIRHGMANYRKESDLALDYMLSMICLDNDAYQVKQGVYKIIRKQKAGFL